MNEIQEIQIIVGRSSVAGKIVQRTPAYVLITITEPFEGLSMSASIPFCSGPAHSFEGEYGKQTSENILRYLYELGVFIRDNRSVIRAQMGLHFYHEDYDEKTCTDRFFGSTFPFIVPNEVRPEVMSIILAMEQQERGMPKQEYIPIRKLRPYYTHDDRWELKNEIKTTFKILRNQLAKYFTIWKQVGGGTTGYAIGSVRYQIQKAEKLFTTKS